MIAAGEQRRPRGSAEGRRVEIGITESRSGERVHDRSLDQTAEGRCRSVADIVEQNPQYVGGILRGTDLFGEHLLAIGEVFARIGIVHARHRAGSNAACQNHFQFLAIHSFEGLKVVYRKYTVKSNTLQHPAPQTFTKSGTDGCFRYPSAAENGPYGSPLHRPHRAACPPRAHDRRPHRPRGRCR